MEQTTRINNTEAIKYYYDHPVEFVEDIIGTKPTRQQREVLQALAKHKAVSVKSGHGVGKTAVESWAIMWFMFTRPYAKIPCTAPTQHQLFDVLWSELKKWIDKSKIKDFFEWTQTHLYNKKEPQTWFAVARSSNKPDNMQGFHADELMFVLDEASGIPQEIMEVVQGALTNEGAYCLMCGNPTQLSGTFYDSFHKDRKFWHVFTFSCVDSEIVSKEYIERMKGKYGEDSNIYKVRVLGDFPTLADDSVINLSDVEKAVVSDTALDPTLPVHIGVDVARFGDDRTVIIVRQGRKVTKLISYTKKSTMETAGYVLAEVTKYPNNQVYINVDDSGVGGGVTDRLNEFLAQNNKATVVPVNNGSTAQHPDKYVNLGTELWWNMRDNISDWDIPNDEELIGELTTRKYSMTSAGKLQLERKDDMKDRGLTSPDKADALSLAFMQEIKPGFIIDW